MLRLFYVLMIPAFAYAAVQCFVGQKLFSYESNNVNFPFLTTYPDKWIPLFALVSFPTTVPQHVTGGKIVPHTHHSQHFMEDEPSSLDSSLTRNRSWFFAALHWLQKLKLLDAVSSHEILLIIRDVRMGRDGTSRVEVTLEVCQYETEREHCNIEKMTDVEKKRFNTITKKLQRFERSKSTSQKNGDSMKTSDEDKTNRNCETIAQKDCAKEIQTQIRTCCIGNSSCDYDCLKAVERSLSERRIHKTKGCTIQENQLATDCYGHKINSIISQR